MCVCVYVYVCVCSIEQISGFLKRPFVWFKRANCYFCEKPYCSFDFSHGYSFGLIDLSFLFNFLLLHHYHLHLLLLVSLCSRVVIAFFIFFILFLFFFFVVVIVVVIGISVVFFDDVFSVASFNESSIKDIYSRLTKRTEKVVCLMSCVDTLLQTVNVVNMIATKSN